jgi:octaprenyl-diphosphate synthase
MPNKTDKIQEIIDFLENDLKKIDEIILEFSIGKSPLIKEIAHHLISSGGKRIRPIYII